MCAARALPDAAGSDGCAACCGMSGRPSQWLSLNSSTTVPTGWSGTQRYGDRRREPREVEERELHDAPRRQKPPPPGTRPAPLVEVQPQGAMVQHSGIGFELMQALDVPVLQMVEQPVDVDSFFRISIPAVSEQVIEVPKLALPVRAVQRAALSEPQLVEQLVEVPTVLSYSLLQQRTAEQIIDFPVPGRGGGARGGLQGLPQGQGSTASAGEQTFVPARGGLQGLPQGQVPQRLPVSRPSSLLVEVFKVFPKDRFPQRLPVSRPSFLLVEVFMVSLPDRVQRRFRQQNAFLSGLWSKSSTFLVEVFLLVFFRPHQLGLLMRALLVVAVVWARRVLLVILHLVLCLLTARQVLLVKMPLVVLLLASRLVLLVTMPLVCLLELSLVLAVIGLAQDRVQQHFVDAGLLDRSSWSLTLPGVWASSSPSQRRLSWLVEATSGSPRPTLGAFSQAMTSSSPLGSCPLVGGKRSTWNLFRVVHSLRGSSARVHCRMRSLQRVLRELVYGYVYMDKGCASFLWFWCSYSLPYVSPSTRASVGVWIRFHTQGLRLSLLWFWCSCVPCQTLVFGSGSWAWFLFVVLVLVCCDVVWW